MKINKIYQFFKENLLKYHNDKIRILEENWQDIYVFGNGRYGQLVSELCRKKNIPVKGFINSSNYGQVQDKNALIIISSLFSNYTIFQLLQSQGFSNLLPFLVLFAKYDSYLNEHTAFDESLEDYLLDISVNKDEYLKSLQLFNDEKSQETFKFLMNRRLDYDYSKPFSDSNPFAWMYFENAIMTIGKEEVFIDGGGYTGDTSLKFIKIYGENYKKIFIFEPCKENFSKARETLRNYNNIIFINKGINNENKTLYLDTNLEKIGCYLNQDGNESVETVSLDSVIDGPVSFIKFDIEGYEKRGLLGAKNIIENYKPKLSICSYHKPRDLWELPQVIKKLNPDYKLYLRIYENTLESVIYAV